MIARLLAALLGVALLLFGERLSPPLHRAIPIVVGAAGLSWALLRAARWLLGYEKSPEDE